MKGSLLLVLSFEPPICALSAQRLLFDALRASFLLIFNIIQSPRACTALWRCSLPSELSSSWAIYWWSSFQAVQLLLSCWSQLLSLLLLKFLIADGEESWILRLLHARLNFLSFSSCVLFSKWLTYAYKQKDLWIQFSDWYLMICRFDAMHHAVSELPRMSQRFLFTWTLNLCVVSLSK